MKKKLSPKIRKNIKINNSAKLVVVKMKQKLIN